MATGNTVTVENKEDIQLGQKAEPLTRAQSIELYQSRFPDVPFDQSLEFVPSEEGRRRATDMIKDWFGFMPNTKVLIDRLYVTNARADGGAAAVATFYLATANADQDLSYLVLRQAVLQLGKYAEKFVLEYENPSKVLLHANDEDVTTSDGADPRVLRIVDAYFHVPGIHLMDDYDYILYGNPEPSVPAVPTPAKTTDSQTTV
jgi:hypothetical protein